MKTNAEIIETAFANQQNISAENITPEVKHAIITTITQLDKGEVRIAEKKTCQWQVNQWAKKAILLSFRLYKNEILNDLHFFRGLLPLLSLIQRS